MSALVDRLRVAAAEAMSSGLQSTAESISLTAQLVDEHEAAALALSAQGKGPHAAASLRWAAEQLWGRSSDHDDVCDDLRYLADEAEAAPISHTTPGA